MVYQGQLELEVANVMAALVFASNSCEASNNIDAVQDANMLWNDKWIKDYFW